MNLYFRILIAGFLLSLGGAMLIAWIANRAAYSAALQSFEEGRPNGQREDDYEFITRGIKVGMSYDEVKGKLPNAKFGSLAKDSNSTSMPYIACFRYNYTGRPLVPLCDWEKVYVAEEYTLLFDQDQQVRKMKYRIFARGTQDIDVNLEQKCLSETLKRP